VLSIVVAPIADVFSTMGLLVSAIGAPLLAVFSLGMLTRRTSATAALAAMGCGGLFSLAFPATSKLAASRVISPPYATVEVWNVVFAFAFTFALGYVLSFIVGRRRENAELRGLVAGCGKLGVRSSDEAIPLISAPEEQSNEERTDLTGAAD
jgi:Na+/proline symporter